MDISMDAMREQIAEKEDELRSLASQLSQLVTEHSNKHHRYEQGQKALPLLQKKLVKKTEMVSQEQKDNEIISSKISKLEYMINEKEELSNRHNN